MYLFLGIKIDTQCKNNKIMNSFQSSEKSNIVSQTDNGKLSRDELKSVFY